MCRQCVYSNNIYIPPDGSKYSSDQHFPDIIDMKKCTNNIILMGDFNARTSNDNDVCDFNVDIVKTLGLQQADIDEIYDTVHLNTQLQDRRSKDKLCNKYGKRLLELCKTAST